jgi:capsular exopolysaccharide synthesis family protein
VLTFACLAGLVAGLALARIRTPTYQAQTLVEIQGINENYMNIHSVDPIAPDEALAPSYLATQLQILKSRPLLRRVSDHLNLADRAEFAPREPRASAWLRKIAFSQPKVAPDAKSAVLDWLQGTLKVRTVQESRVIEVTANSSDRELAPLVTNTLADEYIAQTLDLRWESIKGTSDWITKKLEELRLRLEGSERVLQDYAQKSGVMFMSDGQNSIAETKLMELESELSRAEGDRVQKQAEYELASLSKPDFFPKAAEDSAAREYSVKLTDLRRQLAQLRDTFTPSYYKVQEVQAEIKEMESALAAEHGILTKRIANSFVAAQRRENLLRQQYLDQTRLVSEQAGKIVRYNVLRHEVKSNQDIYELLLKEMKEAGLAAAMHANNIRILQPAEPPVRPYSPDPTWYSVIGSVSGLFFGVLFVLGKQHSDRRLRNPGQSSRYLNVSELGFIPKISSRRLARLPRRETSTLNLGAAGPDVVSSSPNDQKLVHGLVSWHDKTSFPAECFRSAVASIRLSAMTGVHPGVIVFTSAGPAEGKTTTVANFGIVLAEIEKSVLLVDADVYRPHLHDLFGIDNTTGLTTVLSADGPLADYQDTQLSRKTDVPGLSILPAGPAIRDVNGLMNSERLAMLLRRLKQRFGTVLIDTPPALGVSYARVLARQADGAVLVMRAEQTTIDSALAAYSRLVEDRIHVLGTILNGVDPKIAGSPYQAYY